MRVCLGVRSFFITFNSIFLNFSRFREEASSSSEPQSRARMPSSELLAEYRSSNVILVGTLFDPPLIRSQVGDDLASLAVLGVEHAESFFEIAHGLGGTSRIISQFMQLLVQSRDALFNERAAVDIS